MRQPLEASWESMGGDEDDARVQIESDLLKYCFNENPYLSLRLVCPGNM